MLLNELNEVSEIDDHINRIHDELSQLYQRRLTLIKGKSRTQTNLKQSITSSREQWAQTQYQALSTVWHQYGVAVPSYRYLKNRLIKARTVLSDVTAVRPEWHNVFAVVLVPPSDKLPFPLQAGVRTKQSFITAPDYVDTSVPAAKLDKQWRVLLVYKEQEGLYAGSLEMMLHEKEHVVAGHDVTALGVREYVAFSLQQTQPIDSKTWTVLPKSRLGDGQIACAACVDGQFQFVVDEINSVFGDNRFRPAIEVKA